MAGKKAVQIDLKNYGDIWKNFCDALIAKERAEEPRETLEQVKRRLIQQGKLNE